MRARTNDLLGYATAIGVFVLLIDPKWPILRWIVAIYVAIAILAETFGDDGETP